MLRIYGDSDDTLIVEHTEREPLKVHKGARYDGSDLVIEDYVLYDDNLFDVDVAQYEIHDPRDGFRALLTTTWGERDLGNDYIIGQRYYKVRGPKSSWILDTVSVQSERNPSNHFTELHITGPSTQTQVRRVA